MKAKFIIFGVLAFVCFASGIGVLMVAIQWSARENALADELNRAAHESLQPGVMQTLAPVDVAPDLWCKLGIIARVSNDVQIIETKGSSQKTYVEHRVKIKYRVADDAGKEITSGETYVTHADTVRILDSGHEFRKGGGYVTEYFFDKVEDRFGSFKAPASGRIVLQMQVGGDGHDPSDVEALVFDHAYPAGYWRTPAAHLGICGLILVLAGGALTILAKVFAARARMQP